MARSTALTANHIAMYAARAAMTVLLIAAGCAAILLCLTPALPPVVNGQALALAIAVGVPAGLMAMGFGALADHYEQAIRDALRARLHSARHATH